jgi:hypothetical protein
MKDLQCIQVLVPLRHLCLNPDVCGLRRCFGIGYSDEELRHAVAIALFY